MRFVRIILFLIVCLGSADAKPATKHVLLLNSYHNGYLFSDEIVRGIRETFSGADIALHVEYLDSKHQNLADYTDLTVEILKRKNRNTKYDVIICSDNNAFNLMRQYRSQIYGTEIPVVFCGVNYLNPDQLQGFENCTGINEEADILANCALIRELNPARKNLFILTDTTTTGDAFRDETLKLMPDLKGIFEQVTLAADLTIAEIDATLKQLDDSWVVLYSFYFNEPNGSFIEYDTSARLIVETSPVPVHCLWRFSMGSGMIGGRVVDGYLQGASAAGMVRSILAGTPASEIPILFDTPLHNVFDYNALMRFGISTDLLPADRTVINQPPTLYATYKYYFWGVVIGFPTLTMIIITLSHNLHRSLRAEAALRESQKKLKGAQNYITSVIDSSPSWLIGIDDHMRITQLNKTASDESGLELEQIKGSSITRIFPGLEPYIDQIQRSLQTDETIKEPKVELSLHPKMEFAGMTIYPLSSGELNGAVIRVDDVTQQVQMEQALEQQSRMQAIGQLAGGVAHDFNNLLCGIFGLTETLEEHVDSEGQRYLQMILTAAKRAAELTSQLLTFSRKSKIKRKPVNMHSSIEDTVKLLFRTLKKNISIQSELRAERFTVAGDEAQLHSALLNLGINAGHAMPQGGELSYRTKNIELRPSECEASAFNLQPGPYLEIEVCDTGSGISAEHLTRIFEPFFTTREIGKGTGLGLAVVYGTIEALHGQISVQSTLGAGTVFTIHLPLIQEELVAEQQ
jgi:PAS domain S-box-containing protein